MLHTEDFIKRLEYIMEHFGLSASAFADKINVQRSSISHLLSGRNKPSLEFVMKVVDVFTDLNLYWLLDGKGSFLRSNDGEKITSNELTNPATPPEKLAEELDKSLLKEEVLENRKINPSIAENLFSPKSTGKVLEKIVLFYTDGSFVEYNPSTLK